MVGERYEYSLYRVVRFGNTFIGILKIIISKKMFEVILAFVGFNGLLIMLLAIEEKNKKFYICLIMW